MCRRSPFPKFKNSSFIFLIFSSFNNKLGVHTATIQKLSYLLSVVVKSVEGGVTKQ